MKKIYLLLSLVCMSRFAEAQTQPAIKKGSYVDSAGRFYQQASLPTYIQVSTSPNETPYTLQPLAGGQKMEKKAIQLDGHGMHLLHHFNRFTGKEEIFQIFADGVPPVSGISFQNAPHHQAAGQHYYGRNLSVTLSAKDEMSGLKNIYQSLNGQAFVLYSPADFSKEGKYDYKYFGEDNTGNAETPKNSLFTVDLSPPVTYHHIIGISSQQVISVNSALYLTRSDSLSGVSGTFYKFDNEPFRPYPAGNIPFKYLTDDEHTLTYYSTDRVKNEETSKSVTFYLDKTAPITSADVLGDRFVVGEKVYFSGRTKLKLTAVDNKSGVKDLMYSIDNQPFTSYSEPFYLPGKSGYHTVRFYAIDNMQNTTTQDSYIHSVGIIYVDLTGPAMSRQYTGPVFQKGDTTYISPATRISFSATDPESGLKEITYSLDKQTAETTYKQYFTIEQPGVHVLDYFGYDNVNNRNVARTIFNVDTQAPEIFYNFSAAPLAEGGTADEVKTYPSYVTLYLGATDRETGGNAVTYSINDGKPLLYANAPVRGFKKDKEYVIRIMATDLLGNQRTKEIRFRTAKY